jgi:hypothetical protein
VKDADAGENIILIFAEIFKKARKAGLQSEKFKDRQKREKSERHASRFPVGVKKEVVLFGRNGFEFCR